ncbi:nucleotide-binding protein [Cryptosporangium minutisporangium]|uniref:CD-NTase-associated protein 12/Pycsar effector protein TIR domain-containing protein n=1 Tax=Cryptosporangium minutisporangium TaxID=113569 RepID=A0ABP6SYS0_9ACTN
MASNPPSHGSTENEPNLLVSRGDLQAALEDRIALGEEFKSRQIAQPGSLKELRNEYYSWGEYNVTLLKRSFTTSELANEYSSRITVGFGGSSTPAEEYRELIEDISADIRRLNSIKDRLALYPESTPKTVSKRRDVPSTAQDVFIVHGHDNATLQTVARFIRQVTQREPVILREMPNSGRTIIEKFEDHAESIGFAIVLLTGDDEGGVRGSADLRLRARQNVILELGFFISALGRERVAAIHEADVELPSDVSGMLYTSLGSDWRFELGREMRTAGIDVDLNAAR